MIKVLAIGNSFSDDARTYIPQIAAASGIDLMIGNLYIGGCPLELHDKNATEDNVAYQYTKTGYPSRAASIREALEEEDWDFVTMQQASHFSGMWNTYQPHLTRLSEYVKKYAPHAEQLIHETWAYETTSGHHAFIFYDRDQIQMYNRLRECYDKAAEAIGGARIIPCGDAMQIARSYPIFDYSAGKRSLNRDGFHASWTHGRYLLGLVWVEMLTGADLTDNPFVPQLAEYPDDTPTTEEITALKKAAHAAIAARYA